MLPCHDASSAFKRAIACDSLVGNSICPADFCGRDFSFLHPIVNCDAADPERLSQFRDSDVPFI